MVAAHLQTQVVDRAMQVFGVMGLSPDIPLAYFWTWGRALHLMDGPDEVHLRTVARHELDWARARMGQSARYFTTPEQGTGLAACVRPGCLANKTQAHAVRMFMAPVFSVYGNGTPLTHRGRG